MHLLSDWNDWCPFWTSGLWLLPLIMVLCVVGMFLCHRVCCGGVWAPWQGRGNSHGGAETPLDIAKRRYARGEITKEQYEEIKKTLG